MNYECKCATHYEPDEQTGQCKSECLKYEYVCQAISVAKTNTIML